MKGLLDHIEIYVKDLGRTEKSREWLPDKFGNSERS